MEELCLPKVIVIITSLLSVHSYPWETPNYLNPVHGLYVKPSSDGTTGDLYVAATEDNGMRTQWVADQAINFLPVGAASQTIPKTLPAPYPPIYPKPQDEANQKRAVLSNPTPTPAVQYAYAMPFPSGVSGEATQLASYPYSIPVTSPENAPKCDATGTEPQYPYHYPFNFFYPHMMSAYSNAMSILKDTGFKDDTASSVMANTSPMWPPPSYAYPMYIMMDPSSWFQSQTNDPPSPPSTSSKNEDS